MSPYDYIKYHLFQKTKCEAPTEDWINIYLNKCLSLNQQTIRYVKEVLPFLFWIRPEHYFYLLYFSLPYYDKQPFFARVAKEEIKENKLLNKLQYVMGWSNRELRNNKQLLNKLILTNKEYWEKELGV